MYCYVLCTFPLTDQWLPHTVQSLNQNQDQGKRKSQGFPQYCARWGPGQAEGPHLMKQEKHWWNIYQKRIIPSYNQDYWGNKARKTSQWKNKDLYYIITFSHYIVFLLMVVDERYSTLIKCTCSLVLLKYLFIQYRKVHIYWHCSHAAVSQQKWIIWTYVCDFCFC